MDDVYNSGFCSVNIKPLLILQENTEILKLVKTSKNAACTILSYFENIAEFELLVTS